MRAGGVKLALRPPFEVPARGIVAVGFWAAWAAVYLYGDLGRIYAGDHTGLAWAITAAALLWFTPFARWRRWACDHGVLLMLGLLGTLIGFSEALLGAQGSDQALVLSGVSTALYTTLVGLVLHLYLILLDRVR